MIRLLFNFYHIHKNFQKKMLICYFFLDRIFKFKKKNISGVGGNRTLVQTSQSIAFFKFSFHLFFDIMLTENCPH